MRTLLCCTRFVVRCFVVRFGVRFIAFMAGVELLTGVYLLSYHGAPEHGIFSKITTAPVPRPCGRLVRANERYKLSYHGAPEHGIFSKITPTPVPSP